MLKLNFSKKLSAIAFTGAMLVVPFLSFNSAAEAVIVSGAKLEITNTNDKNLVDRGEVITYAMVVKNTGSVATSNTYLWINPLNLATYVNGSAVITKSGQSVNLNDVWVTEGQNFGNMQPGTEVVITYKTTVASNANTDNIVWGVSSVRSDQTEAVSASSWSRVILKNPALCGEKTADKSTVSAGDVVTFTIKACNKGNIILNNVMVGDILESPFRYVAGSTEMRMDNQVTKVNDNWLQYGVKINYLNPGQEAFVTFKVTVSSEIKDGQTLQNVAQLKSDETPNIVKCPVYLQAKVLGVTTPPTTTPPTELPNTGPGEMLLLVSGLIPAGYMLKKFKSKI